MLFNAIPQLISPTYLGWFYDTTGSYISALYVFAALAAISAIVFCFARPPIAPKSALVTGDVSPENRKTL